MKKGLALVLALVLLVVGAVAGTLAWLTDKTDTVTNTFTTSDIEVKLEETKTNFQMIPGYTIDKDPKATVTSGSEDCYLFVKLEKENDFDSYLTYEMADGWTQLTEDKNGEKITDLVFYRVVTSTGKLDTENVSTTGTAYSVLKNDKVAVSGEVTKTMMETAKTTQPKLKITAYASQLWKSNDPTATTSAKMFTAAEAWGNIDFTSGN